MNYLTYGDKNNKSLLFIHGLASTATLCFEPLLPYLQDYYVVLCQLDGHYDGGPRDLESMKACIDDIEEYVQVNLGGQVYGLCGFSMGATMALDLIGRGHIRARRLFLDAPIAVELGALAWPLSLAFRIGADRMRRGKALPKFLTDLVVGKDNRAPAEMVYANITKTTIKNACRDLYHYDMPANLSNFANPVLTIMGSREPIPMKSEAVLRPYLPHMETQVIRDMGHGQFLHDRPSEYAERLRTFLA